MERWNAVLRFSCPEACVSSDKCTHGPSPVPYLLLWALTSAADGVELGANPISCANFKVTVPKAQSDSEQLPETPCG